MNLLNSTERRKEIDFFVEVDGLHEDWEEKFSKLKKEAKT